MPKITEDIQVAVVMALAMFKSPTEIAERVKADYGVTMSRQQVEAYNAHRHGKKPAKKWIDLFESTRATYLASHQEIAIAHQNYRLEKLDEMERKARARGNYGLAAQLHEQAAKETGGMFTNRRELTGKDGAPLVAATALEDMSVEELAAMAASLAGPVH